MSSSTAPSGVGALQFVIGAFQFIIYAMKSPEARQRDNATLGVRLLVNAMISVYYADGEVDESEVNTISAIVYRLTDQYIDPAQIMNLASEMQESPPRSQTSLMTTADGC